MSWIFVGDEVSVIPAAIRDAQFGATLPTGWVLTRSGAALGRSPDNGRWISYAQNMPRPEIHPLTLENSGLLIEPEAGQIVLNSRFPNYVASNATSITDPAAQTPFGAGALKLTPNTTSATHGWNFFFETGRASPVADNTVHAINVVLKPVGSYTRGRFAILGRDGIYRTVSFSLSGAGAIAEAVGTFVSTEVIQDTDGYYSIRIVLNFGTGTSNPACNLAFALDNWERTFVADGTSHFLVAYLGVEVGDTVTTPVISSGTEITRPADNLRAEINWSHINGFSIGLDYTPVSRGTFTVLHMGSAVKSNGYVELFNRADSSPQTVLYRVTAVAGASLEMAGETPALGTARTAVMTAAPNHFRLAVNGSQSGIDVDGAIPVSMTTLSVGTAGGSAVRPGAMVIRRLKVWDQGLDRGGVEAFSASLALPGESPDLPVADIQTERIVTPDESSATLTITLDRPSQGSSIAYKTVDGTAKSQVDYVAVSSRIFFEMGQTSAQITILMNERALTEDKSFRLELDSPIGCTLANTSCTIVLQRVIPAGTSATTQFVFDSAALGADWTLTRASVANTRNAGGVWGSVAANLPRLHYHAPGVSGLLLEPLASEQRLFDSVDPGFSAVAATKTSVTSEQTPTGTRQLQWRKSATDTDHKLTGILAAPNADMPTGEFTLWFLARPVNWPRWKLRVKGIDNVWRETRVNLSGPGAIIASEAGTTTYSGQDPHYLTWYQFGLYRTQAATANVSAEFELFPVNEDGTSSTIGDMTQGIDICHAQLEPVAGMTSPIMVTAASAKTVRSADVFRATPTSTWYKYAAYTIGINFIRLRNQPLTQRLLMIKDQSVPVAPDDIGLVTAPSSLRARVKVQGANLPELISPLQTVAGIADTAMLLVEATKVSLYHNGDKIAETAALATAPVVPGFLRLGSSEPSGNDPMSLLVSRVYHWNHAIPEVDAKLFSGNLGFVPVGTVPKPIVSLPAKLNVREGEIVQVPVSRTGTAACQVNIRTTQNTALVTTDYIGIGPVAVNFAAGEVGPKMVSIQTVADTVTDPSEKFNVKLELITGNTTCSLGNATCEVTIYEPPRIDIASAVNSTEGQNAAITVTKTGVGACSVTYRTVGDTATVADGDYTAIGATTLSFAENDTTKTVSVAVLQDNKADNAQKFKVVLENPTNCTLGIATCTVTIFDVGGEVPPTGDIYERPSVFAQYVGTATTPTVNFGVGGDVYYVTTREDNATTAIPNSLRAALRQNNKVIVFEVGGIFEIAYKDKPYDTPLRIDGYNLTIAGETAPYPGVIIQRGKIDIRANSGRNSPNICLRHITIETGYDTRDLNNNVSDCLSLQAFRKTNPDGTPGGGPITNIWIDHCAFFWAMDECVEVWSHPGDPVMNNISFSNCIFAEALYNPHTVTNPLTGKLFYGKYEGGDAAPRLEAEHNYGFIVNPPARRVDLQYNLFSDMYFRVPVMAQNTTSVVANTVAMNCRLGCHTGGGSKEDYEGPILLTVDGYLGISGADTKATYSPMMLTSRAQAGDYKGQAIGFREPGLPTASPGAYVTGSKVWAKNLYGWKGAKSTYYQPLEVVVSNAGTTTLTDTEKAVINTTEPPIDLPVPVKALSADDLYNRTTKNVGPRPKERVSHVKRVVDKLIAKDSKFVNHELDVGGFTNGTYWGTHGNTYSVTNTTRSLRSQTAANPPKFKDGTVIPAFPSPATDKAKVNAWLELFLKEVQYD